MKTMVSYNISFQGVIEIIPKSNLNFHRNIPSSLKNNFILFGQ